MDRLRQGLFHVLRTRPQQQNNRERQRNILNVYVLKISEADR